MTARRLSIVLIVALLALAATVAGLRVLARSRTIQLFGSIVARVETTERRVALTFDDGPTAAVLDSVLTLLDSRGVRATFFVTGKEMAATPNAGSRLVAAGHELGNHTYQHERMVLRSPRFVRREIERTDSLIRASGHQGPIHFRPPFGYKLLILPWYLARTGRTTVTWDVEPDSYPAVAATSDGIVQHVLERVRPGSIILLHVWYPSRATSLGAIAPLIDSLRARGYQVGAVRDLLVEDDVRQNEVANQGDQTCAVSTTPDWSSRWRPSSTSTGTSPGPSIIASASAGLTTGCSRWRRSPLSDGSLREDGPTHPGERLRESSGWPC